jgi:peptidoglycan/xylan/chitin deacetylase (PgdA/CDA1 family)
MRVPGLKLARSSFRRARSRFLGGIVVLGYHRVGDGEDPFGLAVSARRFADQIAVLSRRARPLSLSEASRALAQGTLPRRAVVLTFDDGYSDTCEVVLPVLEREAVPATVFVSTGCPGGEFWWDELTRILTRSRTLPGQLTIDAGGRTRSWLVPLCTSGPAESTARRRVLASVAGELQAMKPSDRDRALHMIRAWAKRPVEIARGSRDPRALTVDEIKRLAASPVVEIGAHTVTHPMLPALTREEQREEVHRSRRSLQDLTGAPVTSFSYPHGAYSADTVSVVEEAGFTAACCSEPDVIRPRCHRLTLPRLWVKNHDAASFTVWLESWLHV